MFNRSSKTLVVCVAATAVWACGTEQPGDDNAHPLANARIEIVVPFRERGGSDTWGRAIAPYLQNAIGNGATVQVVNVLGASGVQGGNEFALSRRHDGLNLFVSSGSNSLPYLLGERAVRYDFKEFAGIMGSPVGGVVYASPDLNISSLAGLCRTADLIYGGISPTGLDMVPLVAFELLGLDVQPILGYQGKGAARLAFEQGETNIDYQTSPAFLANVQPLVDEGKAAPLFSFGVLDDDGKVIRDPVFAEIPSFAEAYEACHGSEPSGLEWDAYRAVLTAGFAAQKGLWTHKDAPVERIEALRAAATTVIGNPEFQAVVTDLIGGYDFYVGDEVERALELTLQIPPASREWLLNLLRTKYDVAI